jgi:cysteine synthase A
MGIEWKANENTLNSILLAIGRTPLVNLNQTTKDAGISASVYGKCDFLNPSGSLKDRVYYRIITEAINRGSLKKGMEIIEVSTGNAGIACTWIGTMMGFNVTIIMPEGMSHERKEIIRQLGGNIIETPGAESDVDLSYEKAKMIVNGNPQKYWFPDQYTNLDAIAAHYETTGPEIWEQTGGMVDAFVVTQGTGGTITGVGRYLRERKKDLKLFAAEPSVT